MGFLDPCRISLAYNSRERRLCTVWISAATSQNTPGFNWSRLPASSKETNVWEVWCMTGALYRIPSAVTHYCLRKGKSYTRKHTPNLSIHAYIQYKEVCTQPKGTRRQTHTETKWSGDENKSLALTVVEMNKCFSNKAMEQISRWVLPHTYSIRRTVTLLSLTKSSCDHKITVDLFRCWDNTWLSFILASATTRDEAKKSLSEARISQSLCQCAHQLHFKLCCRSLSLTLPTCT